MKWLSPMAGMMGAGSVSARDDNGVLGHFLLPL